MSTIYVGMTDRKARFPHERQRDDAPYVPLHELNAALEANRSLVRQMTGATKSVFGDAHVVAVISFSFALGIVCGVML